MRFRAVVLCFLLIFAVSLSGCKDKGESSGQISSKADDTSQSQTASQNRKAESEAVSKTEKKAASGDTLSSKTSSNSANFDKSSKSSSSKSSESGQEQEHTHSENPLTAEQLNPTDPLVVFEGGEQTPSEIASGC